jgi:hypothetical protein
MIKPQAICGSYKLAWELSKEENGYISIKARSHLALINNTQTPLVYFGYCVSWKAERFIGRATPGSTINVPVQLASATHLLLAVPKRSTDIEGVSPLHISDCFPSERMMILSSGLDSNRILRTAILCDRTDEHGLKSLRNLHFLLRLTTTNDGVCDIHIDPSLTLVNLLPCEIQCQLAESVSRHSGFKGKQVKQTEEISIPVGKEAKCLSLDCRLKPRKSSLSSCRSLQQYD